MNKLNTSFNDDTLSNQIGNVVNKYHNRASQSRYFTFKYCTISFEFKAANKKTEGLPGI